MGYFSDFDTMIQSDEIGAISGFYCDWDNDWDNDYPHDSELEEFDF